MSTKSLQLLWNAVQELTVSRWPPVTPHKPAVEFVVGTLPSGDMVVWPSRQLDGDDVWLCLSCRAWTLELRDVMGGVMVDVEWNDSAIKEATDLARRITADLEERRMSALRADRFNVEELERQSDLLFLSGLVSPNWRPGFNLLAPAVWALSRLHRPWDGDAPRWKGTDVRNAVLTALSENNTPFDSITVSYDYRHAPSVVLFGLKRGLYVQFVGPWDNGVPSVSLVIGDPEDNLPVYDFRQNVLYSVVAETCKFPYEVLELANAATTLFHLLNGGGQ